MVISDLLERNVRNRPSKEAIFCKPCALRLTYGEINKRVNGLCNFLLKRGLSRGDRIAILSPSCHIHSELLMAASKRGMDPGGDRPPVITV